MTESTLSYQTALLEQSAQHPIWIVDNEQLVFYCLQWSSLPMIALDTEFMRIDTFYPIPGLIQIADDHACYLIDPTKVSDMSPLAALLANLSVIKVLHASSEDLELFRHYYGVVPDPLFDTQVAAAFAGWGFSMGLQRIVEHALQISLGKGHTRSDWLQRPLTDEQVLYAALDVAYLPAIAWQLKSELEALGRYEWMLDECQLLCMASRDTDPEGMSYYQRFTQMGSCSSVTLAGLRDLTAWREQTCRLRNLCRPHILKNESIMNIVDAWPTSMTELAHLKLMRPQNLKRDGKTILEILSNAAESAEHSAPASIHLPLHVYHSDTLKRLKAIGREVAKTLNILPELLIRRRDLEKLINSKDQQGCYHLPITLMGWRKELIGNQLLTALKEIPSETQDH